MYFIMSENKSYDPQRVHHFLAHMTRLIERSPTEMEAISEGSRLLADLVSVDDWLLPDFGQPHPNHYQQYLLYADPADRFSVVSFVWGPGQATPIHDHTVWGLIGMLRGSEICQPYSRMSDGRWAAAGLQIQMIEGDVEVVSPRLGDVHKVWNASQDQVSISIHIYGANIGKVRRSVYYTDGSRKTFISGYSNIPQMFSGLVEDENELNPPQTVQQAHPQSSKTGDSQSVTAKISSVNHGPTTVNTSTHNSSTQNTTTQPTESKVVLPLQDENTSKPEVIDKRSPPLEPSQLVLDLDTQAVEQPLEYQVKNLIIESGEHSDIDPSVDPSINTDKDSAAVSVVVDKIEKTELENSSQADPQLNNDLKADIKADIKVESATMLVAESSLTPTLDEAANAPSEVSSSVPTSTHGLIKPATVIEYLLAKKEIALIDVREEDPFAQSHPLFACNMSLGRIETDAYRRIPRRDTFIVIYDNSDGLAERAIAIFRRIGYTNVNLLEGSLTGWAAAGYELFKDVNVPSKSFGEWVESIKRTPSLSAQEVYSLIAQKADVVVLDARRFDEYQTMSIPGAVSVPGGELALRARTLAPKPTTRIIVNCAGRTRSIIGTQSLVNAGIPNPVCALRNGTIGWMLAGQDLVKGADKNFPEPSTEDLSKAKASALALAFRSGIKRIDWQDYLKLKTQTERTTYLFDVRTPEEFNTSHLEGALSAPGGQLVQETDHNAPVRGAAIVLYDTEGVRAYMTGSWLVQLGWDVYVIKDISLNDLKAPIAVEPYALLPEPIEPVEGCEAAQLKEWIANRTNLTLVIDVGESAQYVRRHIPGAWWILRSQIEEDFSRVHKANRYILTCSDGSAARYAVHDIKKLVRPGVHVAFLRGGNASWFAAGYSTQQGESYVVSPRIDRYRRPYEGTQNPVQAMQAYLDWEFGLVEQLKRDGTHGFKVI